jgi:hypothetical protein
LYGCITIIITQVLTRGNRIGKKHVREALERCGYPDWTNKQVQKEQQSKSENTKSRGKKTTGKRNMKGMAILIKKDIYKDHGISTTFKLQSTNVP